MTTSGVNKLQTVSAQTLKQLVEQKAVTLIDVREPAEYAGEHIPGATLVSLSNFDPRKIPQDGSIVLYCRSGNRSAMAAQKLFSAGFATVTHLNGGIGAWKEAGYPTNINRKAPISLLRQVQIIVGSTVLISTLLGAFVSPWFLLVSGVMGAGLIYSGITDTCILGMMLAKLPYNRRSIV
ncbi:rhodanese-like domain-containing protein [Calothrix sp. FACHB-1219]|uniref:rhodanese-like domain-containing protein n=1 Tax=unclassified Calothrix TaxID=2619626 RepID=UPI0016827C12|nr:MULTISPECIES: rhodanese-like domain-containing protein [unclassified Calothrix]MBD2206041.1 rhodanese-like domain-containing protein [Calothrix sp. FACHB-168]MBD2220784.1 rhodanese-like domain-containing protein [Calothrix sp. FACHB-1219]